MEAGFGCIKQGDVFYDPLATVDYCEDSDGNIPEGGNTNVYACASDAQCVTWFGSFHECRSSCKGKVGLDIVIDSDSFFGISDNIYIISVSGNDKRQDSNYNLIYR